ncbi:hypothetical protein RJ640_003456 [Escallonia rubra]|uniref:Uncharacterized protein n=1 Tax=Escallonia rubra TaxID=112253 RepID=A0AA88R2I6_9ASTE|nr:hypothetical protein RJ640_003456 [Escallonia rubra]
MARHLSQTLIRTSISPPAAPILSPRGLIIHRHRSNRAQLIELDLVDAADGEAEGLRRLEDVIHGIIARRSAPDWLPFLPGSSYWVPPRAASPGRRPSCDAVEVVARLGARRRRSLAEDESMSLSSARGWPSSAFFIEGSYLNFALSPLFLIGELVL